MSKAALITGASRGIGRAVALRLAQDGYAIAVNYRDNAQAAADVVAEIRKCGGDAAAFAADVADGAAVRHMVEEVSKTFGSIGVLVNNAGIAQQKLFTQLTDEDWRRMMAVHLDGAFYTCRAVLPGMIAAHAGTIVNISSMWGQTGGSCEVHYSAAKAGLIGLTKALAKEVGPAGIRVNCVAPGVIMTDMMAGADEETRRVLSEETPLERLGTPQDVARAVAFLVSDEASFITGQVLAPNGGIVI